MSLQAPQAMEGKTQEEKAKERGYELT